MPVEYFIRCMKLLNTLTFLMVCNAPEQSVFKSALSIQCVRMVRRTERTTVPRGSLSLQKWRALSLPRLFICWTLLDIIALWKVVTVPAAFDQVNLDLQGQFLVMIDLRQLILLAKPGGWFSSKSNWMILRWLLTFLHIDVFWNAWWARPRGAIWTFPSRKSPFVSASLSTWERHHASQHRVGLDWRRPKRVIIVRCRDHFCGLATRAEGRGRVACRRGKGRIYIGTGQFVLLLIHVS